MAVETFARHLQGASGEGNNNNDDEDLWRIEGPSTTTPIPLLARSGSKGVGDQIPPPVLPKVRRDSGLGVLEHRPSFSHRIQVCKNEKNERIRSRVV